MSENLTPRRFGHAPDRADLPSRDGREQRARARQAAEALFAPKPPPPVIEQSQANPQTRQPRILKPASPPLPAARPPVETAITPESPAPAPTSSKAIPPPHVARIRSWLKYGMTVAQVAEAYRVPITEIKRLLGKP